MSNHLIYLALYKVVCGKLYVFVQRQYSLVNEIGPPHVERFSFAENEKPWSMVNVQRTIAIPCFTLILDGSTYTSLDLNSWAAGRPLDSWGLNHCRPLFVRKPSFVLARSARRTKPRA